MVEEESTPDHNTSTRTVEIPNNMSWQEVQIGEDAFSFECPNCNERQNLKTGLFSETQSDPDEGPTPSGQAITHGRTITGNVVAFMVALVVIVIISLASGKTGIGFAIIGAAIFLVLRKFLVPAFMDRLPVWVHECPNCRNKTYIASDGSQASVGRVQET